MAMRRWLFTAALTLASPLPAEAAPPPLSTYGQLPGFQAAALSFSGDHTAIIGRVDGKRYLLVLDAAQKLVLKSELGDLKVRTLSWVGDEAVLLQSSQTVGLGIGFTTDKAELSSMLVVPLNGSKAWSVFANSSEITGGVWGRYGIIQRDSRWYGYFGGVTLQGSVPGSGYLPNGRLQPDLYEVDLQNQHIRLVAHRIGGDQESRHWLVNASGEVGAWLDYLDTSGDWTIYSGQGRKIASGSARDGHVALLGFTPDDNGVAYSWREPDTGRIRRFSVPLAGGSPQPFLDSDSVLQLFHDDGNRVIGYVDDSATNDAHFFDAREDKVYKASQKAFPGERMTLRQNNNAFDRLIVTTSGPGDPITWWRIDVRSGHADVIGNDYPLASDQVGPMKMVPYTAGDGMKMEGVLTLPPGDAAKNLPAIIMPHGGPFGTYNTAGFDWMAQAFASRGFAVFQPNFRGSGGYGSAFQQAGMGEWGHKMLSDISDGLAELVKQGLVDPRRVCIVGVGYGGYAALAGVSLQQGLYRCSVSYAGISDLNRFVNDKLFATQDDATVVRNFKAEIGAGHDLKVMSPIHFADKVTVPVLLIHGKDDIIYNFDQSSRMADALRGAGKSVAFVTLAGEDHWLSKSETRDQMLEAAVGFVMKNNPPDASK